jgi:hypothetical protein
MSALHIISGVACGAMAAGLHLLALWTRAQLVSRGRSVLGLVTYPVGLLGPALAIYAAARIAPLAAWFSPLGLLAVRSWVLYRHRRRELRVRERPAR